MLLFRDFLYALVFLLIWPMILYRVLVQKRYRTGWKQRFGFVPVRHSQQPCIWIHAVSMGEVNAAATLIKALEKFLPNFEIVISTTTDTGMDRADKLYGQTHRVFFFPWDFSTGVARALRRVHPQLCIMMEGEVWPNFTAVAKRLAVPVVVANGRIGSGKGWPRYRKVAPLVRGMFRRVSLALVQDETYAERFRYLGTPAEQVKVAGTLKYDTAEVTDQVAGSAELAQQLQLDKDVPLWVAGQTGPGEEQIILDCFGRLKERSDGAGLRLAIVPRKPERFDEVARLIEAAGHHVLRYSSIKNGDYQPTEADRDAVILGDTMGDLRKFYSLAKAVFVGRSLVPMGGSDMMEVAALGRVPIIGPYTENFTATVQELKQADAVLKVADGKELTEAVGRLLSEVGYAEQLGKRAQDVIVANKGATLRTVNAITQLLGYTMPPNDHGIATPAVRG
ncbi:MAG: 3-deoxy-D-manno-octulosonic acid transferase [Sedimentisphaerales bacterium]|nr:3-deoxy-D-manno-octulosonic acid transferase [Sedimentisphaerales bacterium]